MTPAPGAPEPATGMRIDILTIFPEIVTFILDSAD